MLSELLAITETSDFEDNGWISIRSARRIDGDLHLELAVNPGLGTCECWRIQCLDVLEFQLTSDPSGGLNHWIGRHPAIEQHTDVRQQLYFGRAPTDPIRTIGDLWQAHFQQVDDWIPFDRYLNRPARLRELLSGGSGLLAAGPSGLIKTYASILSTHECAPSIVDNPWVRPLEGAELLHSGSSFVVCKSFDATRDAA